MLTARQERETPDDRLRKQSHAPSVDAEAAQRELVRRIVHSPTFGRSERLGTLLAYVCDLTFKGREVEINEQKIGHAVFGRSLNYDTSVDGIVRSQASRLRQRLELYFQQEGVGEPIGIVIPRGGYVPVFQSRSLPAPAVALEEPAAAEKDPGIPAPVAVVHPRLLHSRWLPWMLSVALAVMLLALWTYDRRLIRQAAAPHYQTHPMWDHLFSRSQPTLVVAPDSGLVLFHGLSGQDVDLKSYLDAGYRAEPDVLPQIGPAASRKESLLDLANRRYTSIVDLKTILSLKDRARLLGGEVSMRYARDLRPNDFKTGNVILLGAPEADPWVELYEHSMNFVFKNDFKGVSSILNRNPLQGEPTRWESRRDDPERRVFGVVAYLPSLSGAGNALLLEGTGMSGAEAGMDFVLDDTELLPFLHRIQRPDGTLPHFELLLETHNIGASAVHSKILASRTMN